MDPADILGVWKVYQVVLHGIVWTSPVWLPLGRSLKKFTPFGFTAYGYQKTIVKIASLGHHASEVRLYPFLFRRPED